MVFQYNPLENYIEVNDAGDTVVTLNNSSVLAPKLRYNVGDEGSTMTRAAVVERLSRSVPSTRARPCRKLGRAVLVPVRPP
jgi:phenylacetate-CoA ligase